MKKALVAIGLFAALLVAGVYGLYLFNRAPIVPRVTDAHAADAARPFVVKLHAQWCVKCLATKDVWAEVERAYAERANLLVLDFTDEVRIQVSRAEARRLGLEDLLDDYEGVSGAVLVLDGRTREILADIDGSRNFEDYRAAIDAALIR